MNDKALLFGGPEHGRIVPCDSLRPIRLEATHGELRGFDPFSYFPERYVMNFGPYLVSEAIIAHYSGEAPKALPNKVERDPFACAFFLDQPVQPLPVKGSEDFDGWWSMRMLELGRHESDRQASDWRRMIEYHRSRWRHTVQVRRRRDGVGPADASRSLWSDIAFASA